MTDKPVDLRFPIKVKSRNVVVDVVVVVFAGRKTRERGEKRENQQQT